MDVAPRTTAPVAMDAVSRLTSAEQALLESLFASPARPVKRAAANDEQLRDCYGNPVSSTLAISEHGKQLVTKPTVWKPYKYEF